VPKQPRRVTLRVRHELCGHNNAYIPQVEDADNTASNRQGRIDERHTHNLSAGPVQGVSYRDDCDSVRAEGAASKSGGGQLVWNN
jgi:hypothetical protein